MKTWFLSTTALHTTLAGLAPTQTVNRPSWGRKLATHVFPAHSGKTEMLSSGGAGYDND